MKKKFSKTKVLMVSLLMLCLTVGGTLAYLTTQTAPVENTFTPSEVTTSVTENFDGKVKTNVQIKNIGDTTAYIRAAVAITWQDAQGNVYGKTPAENVDYVIKFDLANGWAKSSDGFYYWTKPVKSVVESESDCFTGVLIETCSPKDTAPDGYTLSVEIIGSGIQSVPDSAVKEAWSSGVSDVIDVNGIPTLSIKQ